MAESVSNQGFARKKCYNGIPSKFLKLLTWTFIQLLLFTQDCLDGDQVLADSCAYRIVIWVGLDRPDRSSICTLWEFSETEILAQLEVTGGSVPLASKVKGRTVRLKLSQVNSASMDSFRCCTIDPGRRVPVHMPQQEAMNQTWMPKRLIKDGLASKAGAKHMSDWSNTCVGMASLQKIALPWSYLRLAPPELSASIF